MLKMEDIRSKIEEIFNAAEEYKLAGVIIRSGNLHHLLGGYPEYNHRMKMFCNAMREYMKSTDEILSSPPSGQGASLEILYKVPFR